MRLPKPFYRLPIRFDVDRLQAEVAALPQSAWAKHPNEIAGNSSIRLISAGGDENDDVNGAMRPTEHLQRAPYIRQILSTFGVVWGRSRLMRLAPGANVPQHADINYHWFNRVRIHIPIVTRPEVRFFCEPEIVHMAAGEAWVFDNWRQHSVVNPTDNERIHLVADTTGSAAFWQFVLASQSVDNFQVHSYEPGMEVTPLSEQTTLAAVMPPSEIDLLILDFRAELATQLDGDESRGRLSQFHAVLEGFCKDWRQLYALYGEHEVGWPKFAQLRDGLRSASRAMSEGLIMHSNRVAAYAVLEGRVLRPALAADAPTPPRFAHTGVTVGAVDRPIFLVAAPRSGSTLLFESLAAHPKLATLGGEAHWLVESIAQLQPGVGVDSNRLGAEHVTESIRQEVLRLIGDELRNAQGVPIALTGQQRLLEKTPKNALRIPFFNHLFPDALFVFLWRDPRENLSSIMEAWRSGQWKTYNGLAGFDGPWSLLLPPGWQTLNGRPLEEIAAFQWDSTNRIVLDDLSAFPPQRWMALSYEHLVAEPQIALSRICDFARLPVDSALRARWSQPLSLSKYTLTPPQADKWRRNQHEIDRVLPSIELTWRRLLALR